jgi:hypothetical protein
MNNRISDIADHLARSETAVDRALDRIERSAAIDDKTLALAASGWNCIAVSRALLQRLHATRALDGAA